MAVLKDLIVHGSSRFLNKTYMNTLNIDEIEADKGKFNRLLVEDVTATNATVLGLLDVKGELHTNTWTNSNIATIDGSFYITPTIGLPDGGTANIGVNSISFAGTSYSLDTIYTNEATSSTTSSVSWTVGSKILVTGEVEVNGEWMPFGTLTGLLGATSSTSVAVNTLKANRPATVSSNPETLAAIISAATEAGIATSSLPYRNVKISMYQTNRTNNGTTFYPLGIYMSALGANGRTFIDIYGGNNAVSTTYTSAMALPVVRVGNLSSMNLPQVGGVTPNGWGIYTSNGFFSGTVAAKQGKIGDGTAAWTIGNDGNNTARIYAPSNRAAWNTNANGIWIATDVISGGAQTGSAVSGQYASTDPKWYIKANGDVKFGELTYINGTLTVPAAKVSGTLSANTMQTNILSALHAKVNALTSTTATIGSWTISKGVMQHATVGGSGGVWISADTDTSSNITVGNSGAIKNWRLLINNTFGVTNTGALYATSADITGAIKATSFVAQDYNGSSYRDRVFVDTNGLTVFDGNGTQNSNIQARFGSTITLGQTSGQAAVIDSNGMQIYNGGTKVADFGENITLQQMTIFGDFYPTVYFYDNMSNKDIINFGSTVREWYDGTEEIDEGPSKMIGTSFLTLKERSDDEGFEYMYGYNATLSPTGLSFTSHDSSIDISAAGGYISCDNIGQVFSGSKTVNVNGSVDSYTEGATIKLPGGGVGGRWPVYLIHGFATFPSNATETSRRIQLYNKNTNASLRTQSSFGKNYVTETIIDTFELGSEVDITYAVKVSAGVAINNVNTFIKAVRIR